MAKMTNVEPVKLIAGFIFSNLDAYTSALTKMEDKFGKILFESEELDFSHTDYYASEMGPDLRRRFVSFEGAIAPDRLKDIKIFTNKLEQKYVNAEGGRQVNIDPGTISLANVVLASTKDFAQRIYLGDGIYGEVHLLYEDKTFRALDWTYPDYRSSEMADFLLRVRGSLKEIIGDLRQTQMAKNR